MLLATLLALSTVAGPVKPYVKEFIKDSHGIVEEADISGYVVLADLADYRERTESRAVGLCYYQNPPYRERFRIELDQEYWDLSNETSRRALVYHELGHCVCGLDHDTPQISATFLDILHGHGIRTNRDPLEECGDSIMLPTMRDWDCLDMFWDEYKKDLFSRCTPEPRVPLPSK